jgi:hypothetical protein
MTQTIFRNGFFAFLAMVLIAVATVLVLNAPPTPSQAAPSAAVEGTDFVPTESDTTNVVDAHIENDTPAT